MAKPLYAEQRNRAVFICNKPETARPGVGRRHLMKKAGNLKSSLEISND
ncbi:MULTISPECIES: hypothetical protein [Heyndrickxia]|nr:hypothetical protein [Heyndrickxia coagulans]MBF8418779.1 hypothetical protein [Heyndrickxia coagulans]MCR2847409.1 hypothetical protein [Heyndrickxia coagulans]MED4492713.1 hypothetical protein [Heyndrickxia coagulans]MED4537278.1 hypothetical protein [Heyndrickxia coagulans]QJE31574.1 hypothetical protein HHU11_02185 [Heyndrickxia coagulans]